MNGPATADVRIPIPTNRKLSLAPHFQSYPWANLARVICFKEDDACGLQSTPHSLDIGGRAAPGSRFAFHSADCLKRDTSRFSQLGSIPSQKRARRADLGGRQHNLSLLVPIMVLLDCSRQSVLVLKD